jgi:serine/threonine protein kinase
MTNYMLKGKVLGEGAFGTVRVGTQLSTGKIVAVKTYYKLKIIHEDTFKAITREAELMGKILSAHVVRFVEKIENVRNIHLVMEYAGKFNLKSFLETHPSLKRPSDTSKLLYGITKGLDAIHKQRIIHRDLKLENIVLNSADTPKIVDFGFAREFTNSTIVANPFGVCGTIFYMSPELLRERTVASKKDKAAIMEQYFNTADLKEGEKPMINLLESLENDDSLKGPQVYDPFKVDIWALGVIFYYVYARKLPFNGSNESELRRSIQETEPEYKDFDVEEVRLVSGLLQKDAVLRPTTSELLAHKYFDHCRT